MWQQVNVCVCLPSSIMAEKNEKLLMLRLGGSFPFLFINFLSVLAATGTYYSFLRV